MKFIAVTNNKGDISSIRADLVAMVQDYKIDPEALNVAKIARHYNNINSIVVVLIESVVTGYERPPLVTNRTYIHCRESREEILAKLKETHETI